MRITVVTATFHVRCDHKDRLSSHYVMTFADGVIDTHVTTAARRFAGASAYGAQQLDDVHGPLAQASPEASR